MIKLCVIANAAINDTDANGRTLKRLLDGFPKEEKAEFFTYGTPDLSECHAYYKVTDMDALRSVLPWKKKNGTVGREDPADTASGPEKPPMKKTPFVMLCREIVWKCGHWKNTFLKRWLDDVDPDCIFLYLGDNRYTIDLAIWVAKRRRIPIIVYSTEEYPFKDYNYMTGERSLLYHGWLRGLKRSCRKLNSYVKAGFFNSEGLTELYAARYSYPCRTLYQSSDIEWRENADPGSTVSYLGNLGLNRHKALIDIAEAMQSLDPNLRLDIYGNATDAVKQELSAHANIRMHGFVPYEDVVRVIHSSSLLIHAEYSDAFYNRDLRYAFSTKITDSVCSGTPLLVYADAGMAFMKFLAKEGCAFTAACEGDLKETLRKALFCPEERKKVLARAFYARNEFFTGSGQIRQVIEGYPDENTTG